MRQHKMAFDVDESRNFLLKEGYVYTMRSNRRALDFETNVRAENHGVCFAFVTVKFVKQVHAGLFSEFEIYAQSSGFGRASAWSKKIYKMHGKLYPMYLYRVAMERLVPQ